MLQETGVAILPGMDFGRQPEELTCRMAYVDFEGKLVLEKAMTEWKDRELDETFLKTYCPKMIEATELLKEWLDSL